MKRISDFDRPHPTDVDERFHVLDTSAVGRVLYWNFFFKLVSNVPGAIVECGVGRGRSLLIIAALNALYEQAEGGQRDIWAFDSFAGFDSPSLQDDSWRKPRKGEWASSPSGAYDYTPEFIGRVLQEASANLTKIHLVKGYLKETLPGYQGGGIALLNIDCDLYEPYKNALDYLYDQVVPGGIIVFDDFKIEADADERFPGARKAVYEFLGDRIGELRESIKGSPYYVKPTI
ncbi:TylF/MycF/NovP-related O-methyltransferase [Stutzerimonas sp. NM35]